jgi:hypothetical protein
MEREGDRRRTETSLNIKGEDRGERKAYSSMKRRHPTSNINLNCHDQQ